jgi:hypothetical protein
MDRSLSVAVLGYGSIAGLADDAVSEARIGAAERRILVMAAYFKWGGGGRLDKDGHPRG